MAIERLRAAGVRVETGLLADEAQALNEPFLHCHIAGRPLVTIKAATSLDGLLSADVGASRWISGATSRRFAHRLRFGHDAVLVGAGTARRDDPRLTVRLDGASRDPPAGCSGTRVGSGPGRLSCFEAIRGIAAPRVYCGRQATAEARAAAFPTARRWCVSGSSDGRLDLNGVLSDLLELGVQSVLVEGGARTIGSFLEAGLRRSIGAVPDQPSAGRRVEPHRSSICRA